MPASEDRAISDFPIALQLTNRALVLLSAPDGLGGYDSVHAELTEIGRIVLETQYTQDLGNMDVFTAIKNCRVLSGTANPTSALGADGQMYVKYQTVSNVDEVVGLYVKLNGEWAEISTGGSGGDVGIECTQAQYDAWEQAGTLLSDTNYYITDGQSGGGVVIDDTTASAQKVYSSSKTQGVFDSHDGDFADAYDPTTAYATGDLCIYNNTLYKALQATTGNLPTNTTYWEQTSIAGAINELNTNKADTSSLATVATSGSYNDLSNKPTIPTVDVQRVTTGWGTSLTSNFARNHFLVLNANESLVVVWFASTNDILIVNLQSDARASGTGSVTQGNVTYTRNSNGTLTVSSTNNTTFTIIG